MINHNLSCLSNSVRFLVFIAPRDAFTATSYKVSAQNTAEADITVGAIYKFPTEVLGQLRQLRSRNRLLPPGNEVCEGYVFTGVFLSTGGGGGVVSASGPGGVFATPPGQTSPGHTHTPLFRHPWTDTPGQTHTPGQTPPCTVHAGIHTSPCPVHVRIWSTSRQYASHWNAFLCLNSFAL